MDTSRFTDVRLACDNVDRLYRHCRTGHVLCTTKSGLSSQSTLEATVMLEHDDIAKIIVDHAFKAERQCPGAFSKVVDRIRNLSYGQQPDSTTSVGNYATYDDLIKYVKTYVKEEWLQRMMIVALEYAGFDGRIVIEKTTNVPSIEIIDGYTFNVKPLWQISGWFRNPWVACIDGFIESVGEINRLLTECVDRHDHVLLFIRGASDDVLNTLKVNYTRGTINVVPFIVDFDLDGINTIVDISVVAGHDPVTEHKGELISTVGLSRFSTIDKVLIRDDHVSMFSTKTTSQVKTHLNTLSTRALLESTEKSQLIQRRVRSMLPKQVIMRITDDRNFSLRSSSIDAVLRSIKAAAHHGVIDDAPAILSNVVSFYADRCFKILKSLSYTSVH